MEVAYLEFPLKITCEDFSRLKSDPVYKLLLRGISSNLGLALYFSQQNISLCASFGRYPFWCYSNFYEQLYEIIFKRLQFELSGYLTLDADRQIQHNHERAQRRKRISAMIDEDLANAE
ncbi:MAG: hypothetical protein E7294_13780 [Lachnospiraceae bacterium]|nr:hypothetical protein [Lachnospiraceae bacterium]